MKNSLSKKGNVHLIGVQPKYRLKVAAHALAGLNTAVKILNYEKKIDVVIFDAEFWDIHPRLSLYAQGRVYYIDIKICFYRKDKNISSIINVELPLTIQHEFSHVVRANTVGYPETLLDSFIDEGIACFVEQSAMIKRKISYIQKIKNEEIFWRKAKKHFSQKITYDLHGEWFFGKGSLPDWIGYRLWYLIVKKFMNKNQIRLDKLVRMSSKKILEGSGF